MLFVSECGVGTMDKEEYKEKHGWVVTIFFFSAVVFFLTHQRQRVDRHKYPGFKWRRNLRDLRDHPNLMPAPASSSSASSASSSSSSSSSASSSASSSSSSSSSTVNLFKKLCFDSGVFQDIE